METEVQGRMEEAKGQQDEDGRELTYRIQGYHEHANIYTAEK